MGRRSVQFAGVVALALITIAFSAAPAFAHANLDKTDPADGSSVATSPGQVTLTFSESVALEPNSVGIFTCDGHRVSASEPTHGASSKEVVNALPRLADGVYLVLWRVVSADSHPVQGTFAFAVGSGVTPDLNACKTATIKSSSTVGVVYGITRALLFIGLALLIGGGFFYALIARGTSSERRIRVLLWAGLVTIVVATALGVMLQGPYAAGTGIGDMLSSTRISDTFGTRYGHIAEFRLGLAVVALLLLIVLASTEGGAARSRWWLASGGAIAILLAATPGLAGHASTGDHTGFAIPLDTLHVVAMSIWFGGLAALLLSALGGGWSGGLRHALTTFSRIAFWSVIVLVGSGIFASWRQVGFTLDGYTGTSYGHILLVKLGIFVSLFALAAWSRSIVRRRDAAPLDAEDTTIAAIDDRTVTELRRSVGAEVLFAIGVLAATALLVNAVPARSALAPKVFSKTISVPGKMQVTVTVDPAKSGINQMHVFTLTPKGAALTVSRIEATLSRGDQTLPANLHRVDANHFLNNRVIIPSSGTWTVTVQVKQGEFDSTPVVTKVRIR
ncbi:MAG TPA: copper resistance protein CopC [Acidimicrobiia bacterium]|nr:copper resistance protein CopC [Acidimicrobiia bacterium]